MMSELFLDVTVVIRAAGERTEELCRQIIEQQVSKEQVFLIRERPFWKAVQQTFEIGIEQNRKWTLAVDADVLLRKDAITDMVDRAEQSDNDLYVYQGQVMDFIFGRIRGGGPHLYQTKCFGLLTPDERSLKKSIRPESDTYKLLAQRGKLTIQDGEIYGVHDYFQYQSDLFRKAFMHGKKHKNEKLVGELILFWSAYLFENQDYHLMRMAFLRGLEDRKDWLPDMNDLERLFIDSGLRESYHPIASNDFDVIIKEVEGLIHDANGKPTLRILGSRKSLMVKFKQKLYYIYKAIFN